MDIRFEFTGQERDAALTALALRDRRDAILLLAVMAGGAALSLVWPFEMDAPSATRAAFGALGSALMFCLVRQGMELWDKYRRYRAGLPLEPSYMRGLEPGTHTLKLTLEGVRARGPFGARALPWSSIVDVVEDEKFAALIVSPGECVMIPKWALDREGHGDLEVIATLVRHAHKS